jgi:hypothetical protein
MNNFNPGNNIFNFDEFNINTDINTDMDDFDFNGYQFYNYEPIDISLIDKRKKCLIDINLYLIKHKIDHEQITISNIFEYIKTLDRDEQEIFNKLFNRIEGEEKFYWN